MSTLPPLRLLLRAGVFVMVAASFVHGQESTTPAEPSGVAELAQPAQPGLFEQQVLKSKAFFGYGGFEPNFNTVFPEGLRSGWTPSLSLEGTYTDNVDMDARAREAYWVDGAFGLGWLRRSPRLDATADYRYSTPIYQSENVSGRNLSNQAAAGALRWRAARNLTVSAGGHVTQNFERGFEAPLPGVRSSYNNRYDEYGATGDYSWQVSKSVFNRGAYDFSYRNYLSSNTQGEDSRTHHGSDALGVQVSARDRLDLSYDYTSEHTVSDSFGRTNHVADASWSHRFLWFPDYRGAAIRFSNQFERALYDRGTGYTREANYTNYMSDAPGVGYTQALSTRTDVGVNGGYKWIFPKEGDTQSGWQAGANMGHRFSPFTSGTASVSRSVEYLPQNRQAYRTWNYDASVTHRFSPYTTGTASVYQSWRYEAISSRTDVTALTRVRGVTGSLNSQLGRYVNGSLGASYLKGDAGSVGEGPYWETVGTGTLTGQAGRQGFWGLQYSANRRQTENSGDNFLLQRGVAFLRWQFLEWLWSSVRYSHEWKTFDAGSSDQPYHENRIYATITAAL